MELLGISPRQRIAESGLNCVLDVASMCMQRAL